MVTYIERFQDIRPTEYLTSVPTSYCIRMIYTHTPSKTGNFKVHLDGLYSLDGTLTALQETINTGAQLCLELAEEVENSRKKETYLEQLRSTTESLAHVDSEIVLMREALGFVVDEAIPNSENSSKSLDLTRVYQSKLEELNSTDTDLSNHKYITTLRQHLMDGSGEEAVSLEGDLMLAQVQVSTICPLTQQQLKSPMKNTRCGHVYSRQAIQAHIRVKKSGAQCPSSGCAAGVATADLMVDREMETRLKIESRARKSVGENVMVYNKK